MKTIILIVLGLALIVGIFFFFKENNNLNASIECTAEQRNVDVCAQIYEPVCATVNIQCITTPCDPIEQTFSNSCEACRNSLVSSYKKGACVE